MILASLQIRKTLDWSMFSIEQGTKNHDDTNPFLGVRVKSTLSLLWPIHCPQASRRTDRSLCKTASLTLVCETSVGFHRLFCRKAKKTSHFVGQSTPALSKAKLYLQSTQMGPHRINGSHHGIKYNIEGHRTSVMASNCFALYTQCLRKKL